MRCRCDELVGGQPGVSPVCLADLWLFDALSESEVDALTAAAWHKVVEAGQYVFIQGAPAALLFVIKAGRVKLVKTGAVLPGADRPWRRLSPERRRGALGGTATRRSAPRRLQSR